MTTMVSVDGVLVPPERAVVSVFDRGFLYGDSVYEVVRTYRGAPFELDRHLARLARSAELLALPLPWGAARTRAEVLRTMQASLGGDPPDPSAASWNVGQRGLRVIVTRGSGELGLDPALAVDPRVIVIAAPLRAPPLTAYREGVPLRVVGVRHDARVDAQAKTGAHLANVLAVQEARRSGAHEALLLDRGGLVTEGASSNVFAVRGGALLTPPLEAGILEGVTRGVVLELARQAGITVREESLYPEALASADELFITSSAREILPATSLDGRPVGSGRVGPLTTLLHSLFRCRADREGEAR